MRGPTELTPATTGSAAKVSDGLDKSMPLPGVTAGRAAHLSRYPMPTEELLEVHWTIIQTYTKELRSKGAQLGNDVQSYTYWGDKIFTSGPVYFGAIVCFLFVLGLFVVPGKLKWWMLGGSVFLPCWHWERTLTASTILCFITFPCTTSSRTVEMALVIPGLVFPLPSGD